MAVQFPSPAVDGQVYPDVANGDTALENGRIYIYNGSKGIWELKPKDFTSSGGALEVSAIPVMVHADNYEYNQGTVWYDSSFKTARPLQPTIGTVPFYWDDKYWAVALQKEFGEEIFVSDDHGKTWTPHSRITTDSAYAGVGTYTEYLLRFNDNCSWTANDDVLLLKIQSSKASTNSSNYESIFRLQKGSTTWEEVWKRTDNGQTYSYYGVGYAGGAFFMQAYSSLDFLRSTDNGTTWEVLPRTVTNAGATLYSTKTYWNVVDLPDGRIATKMRVYTAADSSSAANHLVASADLGETWTVLDEDMDATYPIASGDAPPSWNKTNDTTLWTINGLLFSSIRVQNVASDDWLPEGIKGQFMLFYTEDVNSGIWHPVGGASKWKWDSGWYSPKQKRYYMRTYNNILMCATEQGLKNNEWTLLDEFGRPGIDTLQNRQYNQYDEIEDRLVFINTLQTFDHYSFEEAPKGLGSDDLDNRLVTKRELKEYLKAPLQERDRTFDDPNMYKLSIPSYRQQTYGPNRPMFRAQPQYNSHKYYVRHKITNDYYPDLGQMCWVSYKSSSASRTPTTGWGSQGFWSIQSKDLYNMYSLVHPNYFKTGHSSDVPIQSNGFIYISDRGSSSVPSYDYDPILDVIIPFTQYQLKYSCIWFDLTTSKVVYPRGSSGSIQSLDDLQGRDTYLVHVDGVFSQYTNQGAHSATSTARHVPLNYRD